ncbi:MAG: hypothetical protein ACTJHU_02485 [Mycetocola sp.]
MSENVEKWAKQVSDAADHAVKVYEQEITRLEKQVADADKREGREAEHVARQVDRDVTFADHHIAYLQKIVEKEDARVDSAVDRLVTRAHAGRSDAGAQRDAEHVAKVEVSAEKHVARALERVTVDIERDATAAARHVVVGLERIDQYEEDLGDEATADAGRVAHALEKVGTKLNS